MPVLPLQTIAENFSVSLLYLIEGMAGIFIFMGVFFGIIIALERLFKEKTKT
jgi:hypothetical protein